MKDKRYKPLRVLLEVTMKALGVDIRNKQNLTREGGGDETIWFMKSESVDWKSIATFFRTQGFFVLLFHSGIDQYIFFSS